LYTKEVEAERIFMQKCCIMVPRQKSRYIAGLRSVSCLLLESSIDCTGVASI